jgi:hypothetical protein
MASWEESGVRDSEITIRLGAVRELFDPPAWDPLARSPLRLRSGMDELLNELGARRLRDTTTAEIVLPASELRPGVEDSLRQAIRSYCELRLREAGNDLRAFREDAFRALGVGMILFVAGLTVSTILLNSSEPRLIKTFFGDGLAVVIAWIGAWYPLDTLINYTRPYRRDRKVLQALSEMKIVVRQAP